MTEASDLDDVIEPNESAVPDHHEHAKAPRHLDDDALARRADQEREMTEKDSSHD
jgi:hypothetical protein